MPEIELTNYLKDACPDGYEWDERVKACVKCPGGKIRSKGKGQGFGRGDGAGPIGIPIGR